MRCCPDSSKCNGLKVPTLHPPLVPTFSVGTHPRVMHHGDLAKGDVSSRHILSWNPHPGGNGMPTSQCKPGPPLVSIHPRASLAFRRFFRSRSPQALNRQGRAGCCFRDDDIQSVIPVMLLAGIHPSPRRSSLVEISGGTIKRCLLNLAVLQNRRLSVSKPGFAEPGFEYVNVVDYQPTEIWIPAFPGMGCCYEWHHPL